MKTIIEPRKDIPVIAEADVVVVGGGPAGIGAALAAARNGAATVLIEQANGLGGMQTQCLNPVFSRVDPAIFGGIIQDVISQLQKEGGIVDRPKTPEAAGPFSEDGGVDYYPLFVFDPECYKYLLNNMMDEAGVKLLYHAFAAGTIKEGNILKGILIESREGRHAVLGKVIIDSTGQGDIAVKSGTPCLDGAFTDGPKRGRHVGILWAYTIRDVDTGRFLAFRRDNPGPEWDANICAGNLIKKAQAEGKLPNNHWPYFILLQHLYPSTMCMLGPYHSLPMGHFNWKLEVITDSEIELRKKAWAEYKLLKDSVPGFENSHLDQTPVLPFSMGHRRISGEYILKIEDLRKPQCIFDDSIAICNQFPDIFGPDNEHEFMWDVPPFDIPYRCLVPRETDNLLAAGSTISADLKTTTGIMYCAPSICTGQAAGTAAALAVKKGVTPRKLDVKLLQDTLQEQGAHTSLKHVPKAVFDSYLEKIEKTKKNPMPWSDGSEEAKL